MSRMNYEIRKAVASDEVAIAALICASARGLSRNDYNDEEIEAAISFVYGGVPFLDRGCRHSRSWLADP